MAPPPTPPADRSLAARPSSGEVARLSVFGPDGRTTSITFRGSVLVGRDGACQVRIPDDPYVSPCHLRLTAEHGLVCVEDVGSVNGVYVRLRRPAPLEDGQRFMIGSHVFRFEFVEEDEVAKLDMTMSLVDPTTMVLGTSGEDVVARLTVRLDTGARGKEYHLGRRRVVMGRGSGTHNFLSDPGISPKHAAIVPAADGAFRLEDLGSATGTWVAVSEPEYLPPGGELKIGLHRLRVES